MKISVIGPTNLEKLSKIIGLSQAKIEKIANNIGRTIAENKNELTVIFNYSGMLKLIGDAYKTNGGNLEMLYTENDYDWETSIYMDNIKYADFKIKKDSWHDVLLSLVSESDLVICAGLSAGCLVELGYMKWNYQEGKIRKIIGIKELLKNGELPLEITMSMEKAISIVSIKDLDKFFNKFK